MLVDPNSASLPTLGGLQSSRSSERRRPICRFRAARYGGECSLSLCSGSATMLGISPWHRRCPWRAAACRPCWCI